MAVRRGIGIGVLVVVVLAVLVVGGLAVYRLGYERGAQAAGEVELWGAGLPRMGHGMMPRLWLRDGRLGAPLIASVPGLLSGLGIIGLVALAVLGTVTLVRSLLRPPQPPTRGPGEEGGGPTT